MHERFKVILVTTDFSELGDHAIGHAFRLAADHDARVILCHVIETPVPAAPLYAQYYPPNLLTPAIEEEIREDVHRALLERIPKEAALAGVRCDAEIVRGLPSAEIVRLAEEKQADLIVISTHGHTGLKHLLLGSVAERVVRHAKSAVLVVR